MLRACLTNDLLRLTNFNVAVAVLSLFILLAKMIGIIMHVFYPILGTVASLTLVVMYTVSAYGQAGPDYADPRYPSPVAWYIRMGCDIAVPYGQLKNCQMAKATFALTICNLYVLSCPDPHLLLRADQGQMPLSGQPRPCCVGHVARPDSQ